jgi:hypothetical protein
MKYTKEDLKDDCEWLESHGIKGREAEAFIICLLNKKSISKEIEWVRI